VKERRKALAEALRTTTIMVSASDRLGTGFFVAAGHILTCAHVIAGPNRILAERIVGRWGDFELELQVADFQPDDDLALLKIVGELDHPVACLAAPTEPGDELWAWGHPDSAYRQGDVVRFIYDGPSLNSDGVELLRVTEGRAVEGFSGSPVLNWRTGGVCGVLRRADAPPGGPPGARLVGAARILEIYTRLIKAPSELTRDRLPWFQLLDDAQLAAGRWCYPGPRLRSYLEATRVAAGEHPYSLALPNAPQLSAVYLRQQASRVVGTGEVTGDGEEVRVKDRPVPADLVLQGDRRSVFVIGGPGTGKSSLLRYMAETTSARWLADDMSAPGVPILVPAAALATDRPLAEALAQGATAALGARLADRHLADIFEEEPLPGIPWIVLIDGVDEILAPERRKRVLEMVRFWRTQPSPYRFLVTSRPLPQGQLDALYKDDIPVYDIEPFSQDQLPEFARRWFSALEIPDPGTLADAFFERLADSQLGRLADIPLIATMLCVVFASNNGQDLPLSRVGLYEEFITLLMSKRYAQVNALERLQQWIRPYGAAAEQAVDNLLAGLRPLLERIADQRLQGSGPEALLEAVIMQVRDLPPAHLPAAEWRSLVEEALRLSGLVIQRSGRISFFHYTIEEYLAVCNREIPADIVLAVIQQERNGRSSIALLRAGVLIDRRPDQARAVAQAMTNVGLRGLTFLAALVNEGVQFPDDALAGARHELERYSATPDEEWSATTYEAAEALALMDPDLGFRYWEQFADDKNRARREVAVGMMLRISYPRAVVILEPVALAQETPFRIRQAIVYGLTVANRQWSNELLAKLAAAPLVDSAERRWAVGLLHERRFSGLPELLRSIVDEKALLGSYRRWAAERLCQYEGNGLAGAAITAIAHDRTLDGADRFYAVVALIASTDRRSVWYREADELLAAIALDPAVDTAYRVKAARELVPRSAQRARAVLAVIADDRYLEAIHRAEAATMLAELDPSRGIAAVARIAADRAGGGQSRLQAAQALAWINRPRAAIALIDIAADTTVNAEYRVAAAHQLDWLDRQALASALQVIAYDKQIDGAHRTQAGLRLTDVSPERGRPALEALIAEPAVNAPARLEIARRLAALESDQAPGALAALSADRRLDRATRLQAALESGLAAPLAVLAADIGLDGRHRVRAALELAGMDRDRGIEALAALSEDPTADQVREEPTPEERRQAVVAQQAAALRIASRTVAVAPYPPTYLWPPRAPLRARRTLFPTLHRISRRIRMIATILRDSHSDVPELNLSDDQVKIPEAYPSDARANVPARPISPITSCRVQAARLLAHYDRPAAAGRLTALAHDLDEDIADQALTALLELFPSTPPSSPEEPTTDTVGDADGECPVTDH
jgi:hypothetical protein